MKLFTFTVLAEAGRHQDRRTGGRHIGREAAARRRQRNSASQSRCQCCFIRPSSALSGTPCSI